jgi:uncharacterized membrane protein
MNGDTAGSAAGVAGRSIFRLLVSFPIACFCAALATDIAYSQTAQMLWADFSAWLLAAGGIVGALAFIAGFIGIVADRTARRRGAAWLPLVGGLVVLVLALFNNLVHSRDAWTSVVPTGLALSAVTVVAMLITIWLGTARTRPDTAMQYSGARR